MGKHWARHFEDIMCICFSSTFYTTNDSTKLVLEEVEYCRIRGGSEISAGWWDLEKLNEAETWESIRDM